VHNRLVAGIDLGSTGVKVLVADEQGVELLIRQRPTPWRDGPSGTTDMLATDLLATVRDLLDDVAQSLPEATGHPDARVAAVAVSGMGESGFLVDAHGTVVAPAFAWFDPRGAAQVDALPAGLRAEFAGRTGLPWGVQVSVAKIAHLRDAGLDLRGLRWCNLPELVVASLGGELVAELSLTSRTGLLDQDTGQPWPDVLDHLGVDTTFVPRLVEAGSQLGLATAAWLPPAFDGAALTVAGHDHLVSAVAGGAIPGDRYHVSMGTAEVLLRVVDSPLSFEARDRLGAELINCVRHVVPGQHVLVAGVKTGLLMRRALRLFGIGDLAGRTRLDEEVVALGGRPSVADGGIEVRGARNDDGVLQLTVRADGASPAEVFLAVLRHGNDEIRRLVEVMDREVPPARSTLLTGGWAGMESVRQARANVLPDLTVSRRSQDTAYGAAVLAARLLDDAARRPGPNHARRQETTMNELSTLERRGMAAICTPAGNMLIVAADQRNGMKAVMHSPDGPGAISTGELADAKDDLVRYLGNHAPAILLDPEVALPQVIDDGTLTRDTALVVGMDASGFESVDGLQYTRLVPGVTPRTVRDLGGDVAKMLWYVRPDRQGPGSRVADEMRDLIGACAQEGLLLIVELLTYRLDDETPEQYAAAFPTLVADAAALAVACGAKVLKLPYPGSADACAAVTKAAEGVPWAVLSAGVDHATFIEQVTTAVTNGASGAMAGRSLWKDSLAMSHEDRRALLTDRALPRLHELAAAVDGTAAA